MNVIEVLGKLLKNSSLNLITNSFKVLDDLLFWKVISPIIQKEVVLSNIEHMWDMFFHLSSFLSSQDFILRIETGMSTKIITSILDFFGGVFAKVQNVEQFPNLLNKKNLENLFHVLNSVFLNINPASQFGKEG